jgi:8-oxo-dGTP pyrophosphatase MutT (NUDIX family)
MHRNILLKLLRDYLKKFPWELKTTLNFIRFVESEPNCLQRDLMKGHVTASSWVLSPDSSEVLLTHHRKLGIWVQLGGHVDGQTEILQAAIREAQEESGISNIHPVSKELFDLDIHHIPENTKEAGHIHYDTRFILQANIRNFQISQESLDLAWVPLECIEEFSQEPSILRMRNKQRDLI